MSHKTEVQKVIPDARCVGDYHLYQASRDRYEIVDGQGLRISGLYKRPDDAWMDAYYRILPKVEGKG
ncbi:hypothetical protein P8936_16415 [Edaphobacter paludis]|uniref:DUF1653 domain-containing protein n=1 Tax=Edaphobacter paludis TaxID=3035702 RepID=A0AAU7D823_9BACT